MYYKDVCYGLDLRMRHRDRGWYFAQNLLNDEELQLITPPMIKNFERVPVWKCFIPLVSFNWPHSQKTSNKKPIDI